MDFALETQEGNNSDEKFVEKSGLHKLKIQIT